MSNKTQLQQNNNNLDALITRVNEAKDVAASLPGPGGEDATAEVNEYTALNTELEEVINSLPNAGTGSEDLETELTTQEELISTLSNILDSKASGGAQYKTCAIKLVDDNANLYDIVAVVTQLVDGEIHTNILEWASMPSTDELIIENIVCDTAFYLDCSASAMSLDKDNVNIETMPDYLFGWARTPIEPGSIGIITFYPEFGGGGLGGN